VLDIACGTGYGSNTLKASKASLVVGVDRSPEAVAYGRRHHSASRPDFLVADAQFLPFAQGTFDVVVCLETIEHVNDYRLLLREIQRLLGPGGLAVISTPNKAAYPEGNPFHVKEFLFSEFQELLRAHFRNVALLAQDIWITSAVLSGKVMEKPYGPIRGPLHAAKVSGKAHSETLFMVALCSDGPLPRTAPRLVLATSGSQFILKEIIRRDVALEWVERERDDLRAQMQREREELAAKERLLAQREESLAELRRQLDIIAGSLGYRLLEGYRRAVRRLFPPGSRRSIPYRRAVSLARSLRRPKPRPRA